MKQQKGGVSGTLADHSATYDGGNAMSTPDGRGRMPLPDMLTYMADMLSELRSIADKNNWQTLSGLLALSHAEAMTRRDEIALRRPASSQDR